MGFMNGDSKIDPGPIQKMTGFRIKDFFIIITCLRGAFGKEGIDALTAFIKAGGTLITFGEASNFAIEKLRVPAVNVLKDLDRKEFYAPGSLLQIELDTAQPLAYGLPQKIAIRMTNSPAFRFSSRIIRSGVGI